MAKLRCPNCHEVNIMSTTNSRQRERGLVRTRKCSLCGYVFLTIEKYSKETIIEMESDVKQICREDVYADIFYKERCGIRKVLNTLEDNTQEDRK